MISLSIQALKAELESAQKRNEMAIQAANLGTWDWNIATGEVLFSELWTQMLGYEHHEIASSVAGWADLLHPDDAKHTDRILQANLDGKTSYYLNEHRLKTKSGDWLWVQARGCVIEYDAEGKPLKHTGTMLDIHDQKMRELNLLSRKDLLEQEIEIRTHELKDSEEKLSSILQLAPEGILTTSSDGIIQLFNEGAQKLFGYNESDVIGQHLNLLIDDTVSDRHDQYLKSFGEGDQNKIHMAARNDVYGRRKDGSLFVAKVSISKVKVKDDIIFAAIINDISELIDTKNKMTKAAEAAELANRAKTDFLANMSHELRTPLNAIIGYAQLIEQEILGPIPVKGYLEYADAIHTSGQHLLSLIQDILDISRIEAKQRDLREEPVDLLLVIRTCTLMMKETIADGGIELITTVDENIPKLYVDEKSLKQILLNLLSNSAKFTPSGGAITIKTHVTDTDKIILEVSDTGIGMHKDDIPNILLPFTQLKNQNSPKGIQEGTGLGLSIVKSFVDLYEAELVIDSTPNAGTTIKIVFPSERTVGHINNAEEEDPKPLRQETH